MYTPQASCQQTSPKHDRLQTPKGPQATDIYVLLSARRDSAAWQGLPAASMLFKHVVGAATDDPRRRLLPERARTDGAGHHVGSRRSGTRRTFFSSSAKPLTNGSVMTAVSKSLRVDRLVSPVVDDLPSGTRPSRCSGSDVEGLRLVGAGGDQMSPPPSMYFGSPALAGQVEGVDVAVRADRGALWADGRVEAGLPVHVAVAVEDREAAVLELRRGDGLDRVRRRPCSRGSSR